MGPHHQLFISVVDPRENWNAKRKSCSIKQQNNFFVFKEYLTVAKTSFASIDKGHHISPSEVNGRFAMGFKGYTF